MGDIMFKLLKNFKKIDYLFLTIILGLVILQVFLDLKMPEYTGAMVKELTMGSSNTNFILQNGGLMLACALGSLGSAILVGLFVSNIASRLTFTLRGKVYDKIQGFSLAEINRFSTASLITRTTNDIMNVQFFIAMGMQALLKAPIMAVWAVTKIVNVSWQWTTATAVAICFLILLVVISTSFAIPKFKKIQTLTDNMNRVTRENLTGIRVIRAANAEDFQNEKFEKCNDALTKNNLFATRVMGIMNPGMNLLISGLSLAIYWIGAYIVDSPAKLGAMTEFMSYAMQVVMAFMLLIMIFILMPRALVSAKRVNEVLDTKDSILPGDFKEKVDPYLRPLYDALYDLLGVEQTNTLIEKQVLEIAPLAYMRGRTLEKSVIILDEAQNATKDQLKMFLTRLGVNSKMIITGDCSQVDLPVHKTSGLKIAAEILKDLSEVGVIEFGSSDVIRHPLVAKIIERFENK